MGKYFLLMIFLIGMNLIFSCNEQVISQPLLKQSEDTTVKTLVVDTAPLAIVVKQKFDFIPAGYVLFDSAKGDLNKDGIEDLILIIKGTSKEGFYKDEYRGVLDRNRRGIIILLKDGIGYTEATKNLNCFSSENEDGGVYYAPELGVEVEKGKLFIGYIHGRYGYWTYTFRLNDVNEAELIGYDASYNRGPMVLTETSVNFLTRQKIFKENINQEEEEGNEVFKTTKSKLSNATSIKLSSIKDFDELNLE